MSSWSKSLSILLAVGSNQHVKRQTAQVPAVCYDVCNHAATDAQSIGKVPTLCDAEGLFETSLADCTECIQVNGATTNVTLVNQLGQWINYCDLLNVGIASAQSVISSASSQEAVLSRSSASLASVQASAESVLGITTTRSSTLKTTTSHTTPSSSSHVTTRVVQTSSPTPPPALTSNTKTIIGAAVGGSIGGLLIVAVITYIFIKRRRKQRKVVARATQPPEKAQLHSDDYKPPREELLGTLGRKQYDHSRISELPSNKPVDKAKELPANEEVGAELDNKVRIPKTEGSSQSTKVGSGPDG